MARRTAADAAETRTTILRAARELFADGGYADTSTADVVERAGVTRGALYHHFTDKSDLFRAVFTDVTVELNDSVIRAALAHTDALAALRGGCEAMLQFCARPEYRQISVLDAPAVMGMEEWQRLDSSVGMSSFRAGLDLLHQQGYLDATPDHATTVLLFGALTEAAIAVARGGPDAPSIPELLDAFVGLLPLNAPVRPG